MELDIALVAVGALGAAVVFGSRALRHLPVSGPLAAMATGVVLGPEVLGLAAFDEGPALLHPVAELGVAIALMAVALRFPWEAVRHHVRPVAWMVTVGMVAMAAVVGALAWWLLPVGAGAAVLIGGALAPTDPVLSSNIVTGRPAIEVLPERLRMLLSVESGVNDGLALPLVVAGIVLVREETVRDFALEGLVPVALALVLGWLVGATAGAAFRRLGEEHEIEDSAFFVFTLVLAILLLGTVNLVEGDGILGVFVGGLAYNRQVGQSIYEDEREVEEGINRVLVLPLFMLFGAVLPWSAWADIGGATLAAFTLAVLVLRRLPVVLALARPLGLGRAGTLFYGWFGPMGAAGLFFATLAHEQHAAGNVVWPTVAAVVAASTVVHGVTSAPLRALYGKVAGATA